MKDDNGEPTDDIVPLLLEVAHKYHIKVCIKKVARLINVCFVISSCLIELGPLNASFWCFHLSGLQVAFHIEPYQGRDEVNMFTNVKYIIEK